MRKDRPMKSRRDFMAALGFGAGAVGLGLPGMAFAWGGRRRRGCYVPVCRPPSPCIESGCGVYTQQCQIACPQYLYTYANGIYYYYCLCCGMSQYVIVPCGGPPLSYVP